MDDEWTTPDDVTEDPVRGLASLRIPTAAGGEKEIVERMQRESGDAIARSMDVSKALQALGQEKARREAEVHAATVETPEELRRLNTRIDDLATGQQRTHRWVVSTTILTAVIVLLTIALVGLTVVLLNQE